MKSRETQVREIKNIISVTVVLALMIGFYIWLRFFATFPSREMTVVDCYPVDNYYEVVVEDSNGEQWAYFSDSYTEPGIVNVLFKGDEIVDVK